MIKRTITIHKTVAIAATQVEVEISPAEIQAATERYLAQQISVVKSHKGMFRAAVIEAIGDLREAFLARDHAHFEVVLGRLESAAHAKRVRVVSHV